MQDRRAAVVVDSFAANSFREPHYPDHSYDRSCEELRKRSRFWNWFDFAGGYFLSDPRLRQRSVPRAVGVVRDGGFSAAARLGLGTFTILRSIQQFRFVREPATHHCSGHGTDFRFPELNSSRIRPTNWTFLLKGPKIGSNSR